MNERSAGKSANKKSDVTGISPFESSTLINYTPSDLSVIPSDMENKAQKDNRLSATTIFEQSHL